MPTEIIIPTSREHWLGLRAKDITSTTVSALFDCCPHTSKFEMWHRLHDGLVVDDNLTCERVMWGTLLQDAIAKGVAQTKNWIIRPMKEYIRDTSLGLGASFDYSIESLNGVLEIKNVDSLVFRKEWEKDEAGAIEAPLHIELQLATQLMLSDRSIGYIAPLVGGNDLRLIERFRNKNIEEAIRTKAGEFRASIEEHREPAPDFTVDSDFISKLYGTTKDKVFDATGDTDLEALVAGYDMARAKEKAAKEEKDAAKAAILYRAKDAERIFSPYFSIWAGNVKGGPRSYVVKDYRGWKVTSKKRDDGTEV